MPAGPAQLHPPGPSGRRGRWRAAASPTAASSSEDEEEGLDSGRPNGQTAAPSLPQLQEEEEAPEKLAHVKYNLRDTPGIFPLVVYGFQHYISMVGSMILIPLVMVPAMGGSTDDMAAVVSTMLLVTGVTTLLHMFVGTRLSTCAGSILCIPGSCPCDHQLTRILWDQ